MTTDPVKEATVAQKIGDECTRCWGSGWVDAEEEGLPIDKDGWLAQCPYFDVKARVECKDGTIVKAGVARDD